MSSSRVPGKVIKPVLGRPMILCQIERIQRSNMIDELVVATSIDSSDDILTEIIENSGAAVFRGSLEDVLDRFYKVASLINACHVVRLTGDCPLIDPAIIDDIIQMHLMGGGWIYI